MIRYSIKVSGIVQEVGFRYFSQLNATSLSLTGYAKNLYSGEVIIEVQGIQENIDKFIDTILTGNKFSKVYDIELKKIEPIYDEKKFKIKY
ncbi:acylphosphatase [Clostridium taeniosporum]|uniref:acylphosphatase n=1 Tax=Clostridium taeniosporum TaxID=394958 RepID=A0A1D7XIA6_9CLOT|nr:acylphosphatase [Clostridium taeniosporum]AOR23036.1 acylphosphatase [Clostridium taeniosporum]